MQTKEKSGVRGFYRIQITEGDKVVGETEGENQITNLGFNSFLCQALGALAGSSQIGFLALGTGTLAGSAATSLDGEVLKRQAITAATSATSKTVRFTGVFQSSNSFVTGAGSTIANIGLFAASSAGTLFAGNTFTGSACATNQNVNVTYDVTFS